jgi:hypothetical protein
MGHKLKKAAHCALGFKCAATAAKRPTNLPAVVTRRNKLAAKVWEQLQLTRSQASGEPLTLTRSRLIRDADTGVRRTVTLPKRVKPWWWVSDTRRVCVSVRYGSKVLELAKGKTAIELADAQDLIKTLQAVKAAVLSGELDTQIEAVSEALRSGFKR